MKPLKIWAISLWWLCLFFALCAIIMNDQPLTLNYISLTIAFISILLSLKESPNYDKDFQEIKEALKSLQNQWNQSNENRTESKKNRGSKLISIKKKKTTKI